MFKSLLEKLLAQVVATVALAVCLSVGAVSAAFALYNGLKLFLGDWGASTVIALLFFGAAGGLMLWLRNSHHPRPGAEPEPRSGLLATVAQLAAHALTEYATQPRRSRRP